MADGKSNGKVALEIDPNDLEIGEIEVIEDVTGTPISDLTKEWTAGKFSAKSLRCLVWVVEHRKNPDFTLEDAKRVKISAIDDSGIAIRPRKTRETAKRPT